MIDMKCPGCGAAGRVPRDKMNTRLICKKCLKVFHLSPSGTPVMGEPPAPKDGPKERIRKESGGMELDGSFDELAQRVSRIKLPRVSGTTAGITALVVVVAALGIFLFSKQSLKTRSEIVARALMNPESVKTVMDLAVPETALDIIRWHSTASRNCGELKMAMGGIDPHLNISILSDGSNGPAVVVAQFSPEGTRLGTAGVETFQPIPSKAHVSSTVEVHLYWVKDAFGNWLLDGTRTMNDAP